jgi:hypothetical protein
MGSGFAASPRPGMTTNTPYMVALRIGPAFDRHVDIARTHDAVADSSWSWLLEPHLFHLLYQVEIRSQPAGRRITGAVPAPVRISQLRFTITIEFYQGTIFSGKAQPAVPALTAPLRERPHPLSCRGPPAGDQPR